MSSKYVFRAQFCYAYSLRILIEYLRTYHEDGQFIFAENVITFRRSNARGSINDEKNYKSADVINEVSIYVKELVLYEFNEPGPVKIGIDMSMFKTALGDVGKKDSILITMLRGSNALIIQKLDTNTNSNASSVPLKMVEDDHTEVEQYVRPLHNPNFVTPLADFAKKCKPISTGCEHIYLHQYKSGLRMERIGIGTSTERYYNFGKVGEESETDDCKIIERIKIRSENIKNLCKLNNISQESNVKFFFEDVPGKPVRLACNVGTYGIVICTQVGLP
jgi:hypothetical protein